MDRSNVLIPVIEYYLGCSIDFIETRDLETVFSTRWGNGKIQQNTLGNWDVYIGDSRVIEIESMVYKTIMDSNDSPDIQNYYYRLKMLLSNEDLNFRSSCLIKDIIVSLEYLLINEGVKIKSPINMGKYFIFPLDGKKEIICLN